MAALGVTGSSFRVCNLESVGQGCVFLSDSQANTSSLHWQTYTSVIPLHPGGWEKMSPT